MHPDIGLYKEIQTRYHEVPQVGRVIAVSFLLIEESPHYIEHDAG